MSNARSSTETSAGVSERVPSRARSSTVSNLWVNACNALKPKAPAPPLIEWTARKMVLIVSPSCCPFWKARSPPSAAARPSSHSRKKICWISSNCTMCLRRSDACRRGEEVAGKAGERGGIADCDAGFDDAKRYPGNVGAFACTEQKLKPSLTDAIEIPRIDHDLLTGFDRGAKLSRHSFDCRAIQRCWKNNLHAP